jgi:hypothetical protein
MGGALGSWGRGAWREVEKGSMDGQFRQRTKFNNAERKLPRNMEQFCCALKPLS